jgi:UDP-N-acetylmuramyl pentapeptide synthase
MKLKTLLTALKESRVSGPDSVSISNLEVDSRNVQRGTCYIAIPGVHVDGATFIDDALAKVLMLLLPSVLAQKHCLRTWLGFRSKKPILLQVCWLMPGTSILPAT